jgi:ABC-type arginine transport system permease subunit
MVSAGAAAVTEIWPCVDLAHICATIIKYSNRKVDQTMSTNTVTLHRVLRAPPEAIPVEMCYLGWQESLAHLTQLVKPNIPD